ncbi:hypothetical protein BOO69_07635 [Sulfitobacter alexandrii]|uniref:Transporter n=1 Tax=Sulfitobacter alexandrii TaxID=1917485 RepID=A0A1J0WG64_9RHOB|nr:outer membrane protein transport protein [Sulfitobacter alexandrii]APE43305.1 hypothetical protein BOO69_07635 [Sulfitobacter alexandrii]
MKSTLGTIAALLATTTLASAGNLDRSGQSVEILFAPGNLLELSFGYTDPSIEGRENGSTGTTNFIGNVGDNFSTIGAGLKYQINENVSFALIVDEPYGSDVTYPGDPTTTALGGTSAIVDSFALTALGRYKFDNNFSLHGGLRYQEIKANVTLGGLAYAGLNGYNATFAEDGAFGYVVGAAYERPDIALRISLTYNSKIDHDLPTVERIGPAVVNPGSITEVTTPESLNLEFQTGIAQDTLLFGSIRHARYEDVLVRPPVFTGAAGESLTTIDNSTDYEIGIGRRFTDRLSASLAFGFQDSSGDTLVSPLAPTHGAKYVALGASYQVTDQINLSGGVRYTDLGDAQPETGTPDAGRANFDGNSAVSVGFKVGYSF